MSYGPIAVEHEQRAKHAYEANVVFGSLEGRQVVLKTFEHHGFFSRLLGGWLVRRELRFYRLLDAIGTLDDGERWLPADVRPWGRWGMLMPFIHHRPLRLVPPAEVPPVFIERLQEAMRRMHAHRVVHLDLANARNILVSADGHPMLLDFASSISFRRLPLLGRPLTTLFGHADRTALLKWKARLFPDAMSEAERRYLERMLALRRLWPFPWRHSWGRPRRG